MGTAISEIVELSGRGFISVIEIMEFEKTFQNIKEFCKVFSFECFSGRKNIDSFLQFASNGGKTFLVKIAKYVREIRGKSRNFSGKTTGISLLSYTSIMFLS